MTLNWIKIREEM